MSSPVPAGGPDEVRARARDWVAAHIDRFRWTAPATPGASLLMAKRLGELATVARALSGDRAPPWLELCWAELDRGRRIAELLPIAPPIACVYLPFHQAGLRAPALEHALAAPGFAREARRRHPFTRYALGVLLEAMGLAVPWRQTALFEELDLLASPRLGDPPLRAELMAHAVMWRTGLGRSPGALSPRERLLLAGSVDEWARRLRAEGEHDALGEVLVAAACAGLPPPRGAWPALAVAQREDGAIPERGSALAHDFAGLYHATLVAVLARAVERSRVVAAERQPALVELYANYGD